MQQEQVLSIEREARLFDYKKRYEHSRDIASSFVSMRDSVYALFPRGIDRLPRDEEEIQHCQKERHSYAVNEYNVAYKALKTAAPLMLQTLYNEGLHIINDCRIQIEIFADITFNSIEYPSETKRECYDRTGTIDTAIDTWNTHIREELDAGRLELSHL